MDEVLEVALIRPPHTGSIKRISTQPPAFA